jgi:hypothetical protein
VARGSTGARTAAAKPTPIAIDRTARVLRRAHSRGEDDLAATDAGCNVIVCHSDGADAGEQFTYAHRAV